MKKALALHEAQSVPAGRFTTEADRSLAFKALNRVRASLMDDDWGKKVLAFHTLYGVPVGEQGTIAQLNGFRRILRRRLLAEEVDETLQADLNNDLLETIDGLLDTIYVAVGWLIELGLTPAQINAGMEEVHASNMTKVDDQGQPIFDEGGKVLKGDNYIRVDLASVLDLSV
jgi:predicted HAD superfamily Cof-like phosphohydrolase